MNGRIAKRIRRAVREQSRYWRLAQVVQRMGIRAWLSRVWAAVRNFFAPVPKSGQRHAEPEKDAYRAAKRAYTRGGSR